MLELRRIGSMLAARSAAFALAGAGTWSERVGQRPRRRVDGGLGDVLLSAALPGVRRLAMEALPWPDKDTPGPIRAIPSGDGGYLAQPDMRRLITTALDLDWSLWAYEAVIEITPHTDQAELLTMEFTNWREREQAGHLCRLAAVAPAEPLLVWCGNGHAGKTRDVGEWVPMGWHFRAMSGTDPFVID